MRRNQLPPSRNPTPIVDTIVLSYPKVLHPEQRSALMQRFQQQYPNHRVAIVDGGGQVSLLSQDERLSRIEAKLDKLLEALADEAEIMEDQPMHSLDGDLINTTERDASAPL